MFYYKYIYTLLYLLLLYFGNGFPEKYKIETKYYATCKVNGKPEMRNKYICNGIKGILSQLVPTQQHTNIPT